MRWHISHRYDPPALAIANRHYNRQTPDSPQYAPPGACVCLVIPGKAVWVTSRQQFVQHAWPGAWNNALFRNEAGRELRSSELIAEALAATRFFWSNVPSAGVITFVNDKLVRHKRDPGRCYRRAGFREVGRTKERDLLVLHLEAVHVPPAAAPIGATMNLWGAA